MPNPKSPTGAVVLTLAWLAFIPHAAPAETLHVPDDHKTIQAAIDAAGAGDTVIVDAGTYKERLRLKPGVVVRSAGEDAEGQLGLKRAEATVIDGEGVSVNSTGVVMAEGATLDGFTITNVGVYDDAKWNKHHATRGEEQAHEHIGEAGTPGIEVTGVTCTVKNNIVHHIGYTGIAVTGAEGERTSPQIVRNVCYRNMGAGIGSMKRSTAVIEGNTCFQNFYAGIGHDDASPLVIGNTCYENIRAGIGVSEGSSPVVRQNRCYRNRRAGIGIRTGADTRPVVEENDCYENEMAGIGTRDDARPVIRNNRCFRNKMVGIGSRTGAQPIIVDNKCYENGLAGIAQRHDTRPIIVRNDIHHNKTAGIGFESGPDGEAIVIDNRVVDNARVAVGINSGWSVHLIGNELSRKDGLPPIVMVDAEASADFIDNTIRGGGVAGIRVAGRIRALDNRLNGNALRKVGPPSFAVWGLPGAHIDFAGNRVTSWRHAIYADRAKVTAWNNTISDYWQSGIRVHDPTAPVHVFDNLFRSAQQHPPLDTKGATGFTEGNRIESGARE